MMAEAWAKEDLKSAQSASVKNRVDVELSDACGCYACGKLFAPAKVRRWIHDGQTAVCPNCGIQAVIPRKACSRAADKEFLRALKRRYLPTELDVAHKFSSYNRESIEASKMCGCFYCQEVFPASDVNEWLDHEPSAFCPKCGINSVIGDAGWPQASDPAFLKAMNERWFQTKAK